MIINGGGPEWAAARQATRRLPLQPGPPPFYDRYCIDASEIEYGWFFRSTDD
jgi:hypothetical protein